MTTGRLAIAVAAVLAVVVWADAAQAAVGDNIVSGIKTGATAPNITYFAGMMQNGTPNYLTDGLYSSYDHYGSVDTAAWWKIDWDTDKPVSQITIYARSSSYYNSRMVNSTVMLYDNADNMLLREVIDVGESSTLGGYTVWTYTFATPVMASLIYLDGKNYLTGARAGAPGQANGILNIMEAKVFEGNMAPVIQTLTGNLTGVNIGQLLNFSASATDVNNDTLTYAWDIDGDLDYDDLFGATQAGFSFLTTGPKTISLRVSDPHGGVTTGSFTVEVIPEPATMGLLLVGGVAALIRRRKVA